MSICVYIKFQKLIKMRLCFIILIIFLHEVICKTTSCDENESKLAEMTNLVCNNATTLQKGPKGIYCNFSKNILSLKLNKSVT